MSQSASIQVGEIDGYSWIRVCGRGDVFLAPTLKKFVDKTLSDGESTSPQLVVDMVECSGMDSTFMGILASIAIKVKSVANAGLQLCGVTEKNQESLEELGLDSLMEIHLQDSALSESGLGISDKLNPWVPEGQAKPDAKLILDTHQTLGGLSDKNKKEFSTVIETFKKQV